MDNRALQRIQVAGYKSIREMDLELRPLNVLIGPNGAGKSNFIGVFELLRAIEGQGLQVYVAQQGGANAMLHMGSQTTHHILVNTYFGERLYTIDMVPTAEDDLHIALEGTREILTLSTPESGLYRETWPSDEITEDARIVLAAMRSWRVYHFHDTSSTAKARLTCDLHDNRTLRDDAGNLAAYLYLLQERYPQHYRAIVESVRLAAPFFDDFDLAPERLNPDKIRLEWQQRGTDAYFGPSALSDGTLRFICLATLLQMPDPPATILIDEPELGLHPYAIGLLAGMLRSASQRTQIIACTQSVTLVNQLALEDIVVVDRVDGASTFTRPKRDDLEAWLDEYGVGDLWEKNVLGERP